MRWIFVLLSASLAFGQTQLDPQKVTYGIEYKQGLPQHPSVLPSELLTVEEGQTITLSWNPVTTTSTDSSQTWDPPGWTAVANSYKPDILDDPQFDASLSLTPGYWKFRVWTRYDFGGVNHIDSKTPSREIGIIVVVPQESPATVVNFQIRIE